MVHTGIFLQIEGIERKTFADKLAAVGKSWIALNRTDLVLFRNQQHLVGIMREIQVGIPVEVLSSHQHTVEVHLDSGVSHVSDIVIVAVVAY